MLASISSVSKKTAGKQKIHLLLIVGTLVIVLAVLAVFNFSGRTNIDTNYQNLPTATLNQVVPSEETLSVPMNLPPVLWLQASGTSSGNSAWAPAVISPFDTLWTISTGREIFAWPAITGSKIFIAGNDETLRGIDRFTGTQLWSRTVTCGISGGIAADSSNVYFSGQDGYMYAQNAETGALEWKTGIGYHIFTDACIFADSLVLTGNSMGSLAALNKITGELVWDDTMEGLLLGPATCDSIAVFTSESGAAAAWDVSGNSLWHRSFTTQPSAPSISGNCVYLGFSSGKILALSLITGETIWETALENVNGRTVVSRPSIVNDSLLLAGTCDSRVFCLEINNGNLLWETQMENWVSQTPVSCDTIVYASCDDKQIHLLSLNTGLPLDSIETEAFSGTPPIVYQGILYAGNSKGEFIAVSTEEPTDLSEEE